MARKEILSGSGVIEAMARNGKAFKIGDDWFSVYKASQMNGAQKDDEVEFEYVEVNKGGATFLNVEGNVEVVGEAQERPERASTARQAPARRGVAAPSRTSRAEAPAPSRGGSGVGEDKRQVSIIRQNSLTQANGILATMAKAGLLGDQTAEELAELAVSLARDFFEPYSLGDN